MIQLDGGQQPVVGASELGDADTLYGVFFCFGSCDLGGQIGSLGEP